MKIEFNQNNKSTFGDKQVEVSQELTKRLASNEDFIIEFISLNKSKTYLQLKGIHKLCDLYAKRLSETQGKVFTRDMAKISIKYRLGFLELANEEDAFKEAMKIRIEKKAIGVNMTIDSFDYLVNKLQKTLYLPRSFKGATKDEMVKLITEFEDFAIRNGWHEIRLESKEKEEMIKYYSNIG
jgi:hypothetical protein